MHQWLSVTNTHRDAVSSTGIVAYVACIAVSIPRFIVIRIGSSTHSQIYISISDIHNYTISLLCLWLYPSLPLPSNWCRQKFCSTCLIRIIRHMLTIAHSIRYHPKIT
jgi:hypothetical protein